MFPKPSITDETLQSPEDGHAWSDDEITQYLAAPNGQMKFQIVPNLAIWVSRMINHDHRQATFCRGTASVDVHGGGKAERAAHRDRNAEAAEAAEAAGHPITVVWGLNPASTPEHSAGTALDLMVYQDRAAGDWIANYLWTNRGRLGLRWIIWRRRIRSTSPGKPTSWRAMADRGNPTANHMDHPHINFQVRDYVPPLGLTVPRGNPIPDLKPSSARPRSP